MNKIFGLYQKLIKEYGEGKSYWPQWCAEMKDVVLREKILIGMILVQRTSWHNANIALKQLRGANLLRVKKIADLKDLRELTDIIRPAGFYQSKPARLQNLCRLVVSEYKNINNLIKEEVGIIRNRLLSIKGIGKESADTIMLYSLDKPVFIVDEYTKRFVVNNQLSMDFNYDFLQSEFEKNLPRDYRVFQNYHALIIVDQKGKENSLMEVV